MKVREYFRFNLATLLCFVLSLNFVIFANWKARKGYFAVLETQRDDRLLYRPTYVIGWPWAFLKLNGIKDRVAINTEADRAPLVELLSWSSAAKTIAVNLVAVFALTFSFVWLRRQFLQPRQQKRKAALGEAVFIEDF